MFLNILILVVGFVFLIKGADVLIEGSAGLGKRYRIPDFIIGVLLVAFGTSLPEFIVSLIGGFTQNTDLVIGNIVGSNIANIALILGLAGILRPVRITSESVIKRDIPFVVLGACVLFILGFDHFFQNHGIEWNRVTLGDGLLLLVFFTFFLIYVFGNLKTTQALETAMEQKEQEQAKEPFSKLITKVILGLLAVILGGKLVVDNAVFLAEALGVSQTIIGLTIVAVGTSLPEIVTTVLAVYKKKEDIALGNVIGSNTINVFFILGITSAITPLEIPSAILIDIGIMILVSMLLYIIARFQKEITKISGTLLLACYVSYIFFAMWREV